MDWILVAIVGYLLLQLLIGIWASRRIATESDYLVAGRSLGLPLVAMSLFATWFGAETVIGSSAAVAEGGLAGGRADPFGYALCLLGMGLFLAYKFRARNYVTLSDFFRDRYSRSTEIAGSLLFMPSLLTWGAAQLIAFAQILTVLTGIDLFVALPLVTILVLAYTWLGGLLGDVITDYVQGIVLIIGLIILLAMVVGAAGGVGGAWARIEAEQLTLVAPDESFWGRLDIWALPILGSLVSQAAIARVLAARSPEIAQRACFAAFGLYLTVGLIPVVIALVGSQLGLTLEEGDAFLPSIARSLLPEALFVLFMGALISAILSTIDSTLLTFSAVVSHNLVAPAFPDLGERGKLRLARAILILGGLIALAIAVAQALESRSIIDILLLSDSLGTAGLLIVVLIGLHTGFGGPAAALSAFAAGLLGYPLALYGFESQAPFLVSIALALAAYISVSLAMRAGGAIRQPT